MSKTKPNVLMLAYYPHASSNMNGLEFRAFSTNMDLKKLKSQVQSVVLKPSFISRINFLSKDMSQLFSRLNSWKYDRYIYFNPKSTKITIVEAPQNHPNKAVFFVCIKGGIQLKKIRGSQGSVIDNAFWNEWIDKMNTHSHSNKAFGMFQAAQRNLDKTRTKKRIVQGEVQCLGFEDSCPGEIPSSFRLVIGYYPQDSNYDPDDKRPAATKQTLKAFFQKPVCWTRFHKIFGNQPVYDKDGKHYPVRLGKLKPSNISKIKVLSGPVHNPTVWEKIVRMYSGWIYHPALVVVIDLVDVPLIKVREVPQKPLDDQFGNWVVAHHNHSAFSGDGWINQHRTSTKIKKKDPFHGDLYLLQMGKQNMNPNYRHFVQE